MLAGVNTIRPLINAIKKYIFYVSSNEFNDGHVLNDVFELLIKHFPPISVSLLVKSETRSFKSGNKPNALFIFASNM